MANETTAKIRTVEAKCRVIAADLESRGMGTQHDAMLSVADSLRGMVRKAQWDTSPMMSPGGPLGIRELADLGSEDNPRPTEDEIIARQPMPGSRLDPNRGQGGQPVESNVRKWMVTIRDITAVDESELRSMIEPVVTELGGLLSDYKEEPLRTRGR